MEIRRRYPLGVQDFRELREGNYVYVDKTEYVYLMTQTCKYAFLGRPRRFGKSLLTSTLHYYFEGCRELFKGLAIEKLEEEWKSFPVLHFDMSGGKHLEKEALTRYLLRQLNKYRDKYGITENIIDPNGYLETLIERAYEQSGREVVVLIDEYDAPLLDVAHDDEELPKLRNVMRNFYSPLKMCSPYLRFVFITGITKFSQLSIFSELNNIANISMVPDYAAICGITEEELTTQMTVDIELLAKKKKITADEAFKELKSNYDGYHFTWPSPDIYNPYSLMNAFNFGMVEAYWFGTGTPTYLIEMMRKFEVKPSEIGEYMAKKSDFDVPIERMENITPLFYQSGYLTIKDCNKRGTLYTLDIPNNEVRIGMMESLLPHYITSSKSHEASAVLDRMCDAIDEDDMDGALRLLQAFLSTVPYCDNTDYEGHYQQVIYIIFSLIGYYMDVEVRTAKGRVDMVMQTSDTLYIIELKLNQSAEAAMHQIDLKEYSKRFALCGLPVKKVAINFDLESHTLADWQIQPVE